MEEEFQFFFHTLTEACERIDDHYIQLDIANHKENVFRERVYCYELYHQLRNRLGDDFPYKLDGEVDKAGHPIIHKRIGPKKPDLIIHTPGGMKENLAVIEVKPVTINSNKAGYRKDLATLIKFIEYANYYRGILLVYSNGEITIDKTIIDDVANLLAAYKDRILLVFHKGPGIKPLILY